MLGIGGLRALHAMGIEPTVYHMNEGHSAFLALERIRVYIDQHGISLLKRLSLSHVPTTSFTTHTPVPAGIDLFDPGMMYPLFSELLPRGEHRFRQVYGTRPAQSGRPG